MDEFDSFWDAYPKKKSKGDARKAWMQTATIRPPLEELLAALERGKSSVEWHKADREGNLGAYIPYPASWLRAEGWEDEYTVRLPSIGRRVAESAANVVVQPTEEQKQKARELLSQVTLRRVA
jgi:hypothetical protein